MRRDRYTYEYICTYTLGDIDRHLHMHMQIDRQTFGWIDRQTFGQIDRHLAFGFRQTFIDTWKNISTIGEIDLHLDIQSSISVRTSCLDRHQRRNHSTFQTWFQQNPSLSIKLGFKIQIWVKHNRTLITQNPVLICQIYPKNQVSVLNLGLNYL